MTIDEAKSLRVGEIVHFIGDHKCSRTVGPRGGVEERVIKFKVTGQPITWAKSPGRVKVPVKFGLKGHGAILDTNVMLWHREADCPLLTAGQELCRCGHTKERHEHKNTEKMASGYGHWCSDCACLQFEGRENAPV